MSGRLRQGALWAVLLAVAVIGSLAVAEIGLRLLANARRPAGQPFGFEGGGVEYVARNGYYVYPPRTTFRFVNEEGESVAVAIDENGLRNPAASLARSEVILLGDSFVMAANTPEPPTLAGRVRAAGLLVYNAGMDGFSSGEALRLLGDLLAHPQVAARCVVLGFYLGNDFRDNALATAAGPASGLAASGPWKKLRRLLRRSVALDLLYTRVYLGMVRGRSQDPLASYPLAEMLSWQNQPSPAMRRALARTDALFGDLADLASRKGLAVVVLGIPSKAQVHRSFYEISGFATDSRARQTALRVIRQGYSFDRPDMLAAGLARKHGLPYLSLLAPFRQAAGRPLYYQIDPHWTTEGQRLAAELLLPVLRRTGLQGGKGA